MSQNIRPLAFPLSTSLLWFLIVSLFLNEQRVIFVAPTD